MSYTRISQSSIGVLGCGWYAPEQAVGSDELSEQLGVDPSWIEERTGIKSRRWANKDEAASDFAIAAAREALRKAAVDARQLSIVLVATSTPDFPQPPTACVVQHELGAINATAFDVNAVCSGFVFAASIAHRMVPPGSYALVIGVDVYSKILNLDDPRTAALFGDGAGAIVLGDVEEGRGVYATRLTTYGELHHLLGVAGGGSRAPLTSKSIEAGEHFFTMEGPSVKKFVLETVPHEVVEFLHHCGPAGETVHHHIPHQGNLRLLQRLHDALGLKTKMHHSVETYGNTGAASIPITLAIHEREITTGETVLLTAFGGGTSTALMLLRW